MEVERVACFIDGFNLYHAIARLGQPHLKWLDLRRLTASSHRDSFMPVITLSERPARRIRK